MQMSWPTGCQREAKATSWSPSVKSSQSSAPSLFAACPSFAPHSHAHAHDIRNIDPLLPPAGTQENAFKKSQVKLGSVVSGEDGEEEEVAADDDDQQEEKARKQRWWRRRSSTRGSASAASHRRLSSGSSTSAHLWDAKTTFLKVGSGSGSGVLVNAPWLP